MTACEACWTEAYRISQHTGEGQAETYRRLITEHPTCPHDTSDPDDDARS